MRYSPARSYLTFDTVFFFQAFVRVMEKLRSCIGGDVGTGGPVIGAVSRTLWGALGSFSTPDTRIVLPTIHLAQLFRCVAWLHYSVPIGADF
jgi:hypothetical protein